MRILPKVLALSLLGLATLATSTGSGEEMGTTVLAVEHEEFGWHLTDAEGVSLYLFTNDADGVSTCYDECAVNWPPLLQEGEIVAGERVHVELLGTTERQDGTVQVTYAGWPLYYFAGDDGEPGATAGQGVGGVWYLVSEGGDVIGAEEPLAEEPAEEPAEEQEEPAVDPEVLMAELMREGEPIYARNCAVCHGSAGEGGVAPRHDGNRNLARAGHVISMVLWGQDPGMPAFVDELSSRDVAAVSTYIRNAWSNSFGVVTPEEVDALR